MTISSAKLNIITSMSNGELRRSEIGNIHFQMRISLITKLRRCVEIATIRQIMTAVITWWLLLRDIELDTESSV